MKFHLVPKPHRYNLLIKFLKIPKVIPFIHFCNIQSYSCVKTVDYSQGIGFATRACSSNNCTIQSGVNANMGTNRPKNIFPQFSVQYPNHI